MKANKILSKIVIAVLTFCMMFGVLSLAACGNNGGDGVEITLSQTEMTVQVGKTGRLTATLPVEGAKVTWSSSDESVATVSSVGTVKGVKVGTANIVATYEQYTATCVVTVINAVDVTISKETLALDIGGEETLTASASNGGTIEWSSSDDTIVTVDNTGKVKAIAEGVAYVYAACDGTRASCEVTVTDPTRQKLAFSTEQNIGEKYNQMFYWNSDWVEWDEDPYYSVSDDTYVLKFSNNTGFWYDIQMFYKKNGVTGSDNAVKFTLNSTVAGHITVNGKVIALAVGDNEIVIEKFTGMLAMQFGVNNGNASDIPAATFLIKGLAFESYTPEKLATPTGLAVDAATKTVTVTDANGSKATDYVLVFSKDGVKVNEIHIANGGTFDDSTMANGTYELSVYAYADGRYTSSDVFTPDPAVTYTVENDGISYDLQYSGETADIQGKWYYWKESNADGDFVGKFQDGVLTVTVANNAGNWYHTQIFYLDPVADKTKNNKISFKLNSTAAGHISVNGNVIEITEANVGKDIDVTVYNLGTNIASVSIQLGVNGSGIDISSGTFVFTFEDPLISEFTPEKLATPTIAIGDENAYTITDDTNDASKVDGYRISVYKADGKLGTSVTVKEKTGTLDVSLLESGTYTVKVAAVGSGKYTSSDESAGIEITVENAGGIKYELTFNGEGDACKDPGKWYFWNNQDWVGGNTVTITGKPAYDNGTVSVAYTSAGACAFGLQLFYKDASFAAGDNHKLTMKVTAEKDVKITVNGKDYDLKAGVETEIEVTSAEGGAENASISIQVDVKDGDANTLTLKDIVLEKVEETTPETPTDPEQTPQE